jgi:pimeloyl-ACP methyl ester carboxylesterase
MTQHADDLDGLLAALGVERAHVLGISYGGEVAQAFALAYPARVRSLILADTVSEVGPALRLIVKGWRAALRSGDPELLFLVTVAWTFIAEKAASLQAVCTRYREIDLPAVARLCDALLGVDFTARLSSIAVPTCVLVGERDPLKTPRYAETIHRAIPGSELHSLRGAGHAACLQVPATFNATVLDFLARVAVA